MDHWLVRWNRDRAVRVRVLTGVISVLCSWERHLQFTFTVPLSTQVYKWVPAEPCDGLASHPGEAETQYNTKFIVTSPWGLFRDNEKNTINIKIVYKNYC